MPNYCQNNVVFTNPNEANLRKLHELFERADASDGISKDGPFSYFRPTPIELFNGEEWYEWRIKNWGTKWECTSKNVIDLDLENRALTVSFDTAWGAPIELYKYLHENTEWRVDAVYLEAGMRFYGWFNEKECEAFSDNGSPLFRVITAGFHNIC